MSRDLEPVSNVAKAQDQGSSVAALRNPRGEMTKPSSVVKASSVMLRDVDDEAGSALPGVVRLPGTAHALPPLPQRSGRMSLAPIISFVFCVILPVIAASVYYGYLASNQYVSEFRFVIKDNGTGAGSSLPGGSTTAGGMAGIMSLLSGPSGATMLDNFMIADYLTTRQVIEEANQRINVIARYSRPEIDWWSRFDRTKPMESFVTYWQQMVKSKFDQMTGVGIVEVRAFTPEDSQLIAKTLTALAEELINSITVRGHRDSIAFAESELRRAEDRVKAVRAKLTAFRNRVGVIDPASSVVASNSALVQTLRAELAKLETSLSTLRQQRLDGSSPTVKALQSQVDATKQQLASLGNQIGGPGSGNALSKDIAEYEQLALEKLFAENVLTSAMQALVMARASATNQRLYVTPYVQAGRPESSTYPKRLYSILLITFGAFVVWTLLIMLVRSVREHLA